MNLFRAFLAVILYATLFQGEIVPLLFTMLVVAGAVFEAKVDFMLASATGKGLITDTTFRG